jgi:glycosyltransferase involved in cell wall biosynthesis
MDRALKSRPMISVLIPIFNGERYLQESLESIKSQTFIDFEILLIDDGSTDGSMSILKRFAQHDKRVRVISKTNSGLTDTLNHGLLECRGNWIARMDQDDIASPKRLELQVKKFESDDALVLVGSDFATFDEQTQKTKLYRVPPTHEQLVERLERLRGFFPHSSALIHAETIRRIGGYDPLALFNEDWDLWLRLSDCGKISSVTEPLVTIRKHPQQMTANSGSIVPQGEAYISSTVHHFRNRPSGVLTELNIDREELRAIIQGTKQYQRFCQIIALQQTISLSGLSNKRWIQMARKLIRLDLSVWLILFWLNGTSAPKFTARQLMKELASTI